MENQEKKEEFDSSLRLIIKSSLFVFLGVIFSKIFAYLYRIIIARSFGPEVYGLFSLALIVFLWFISLSALGFYDGVLRFIPFYRGQKKINNIRYLFKFSSIVLIISSIISGILLFLSSEIISIKLFHNSDLIIFLKVFSFMLPAYIFAYFFLTIMQAFEKIKIHSFFSDFLINLIKLILILFFIFIGLKTNAVVFSYFFGIICLLLISYFYSRKKISEIFEKTKLKKKIKEEVRKNLFSYSVPLLFLSILSSLFLYIDSFVIGYFLDAVQVGIYNAAIPITEFLSLFPCLFMRLFFPMITRKFSQKDIPFIKNLSIQIEKWILMVNLPIFALMFLFSGAFINILFGPQYIAAETALRFLSVGLFFFYSIALVSNNLLSMLGKSKIILIDTIVTSVVNLILCLILVPIYGINGAAFATMIMYIVLSLVFFIQSRHYFSGMSLVPKFLRIFLSILIPTILLAIIKQFIRVTLISIILEGLIFFSLYLFLLFFTKSLEKNDFMILSSIKKKIFHSS